MGAFAFTATRSLLPYRGGVSQAAVLEIDLVDSTPSRNLRSTAHRSSSGRSTESLYESAETQWDIQFMPASGALLARLTEFLASTAEGEAFTAWLYGDESTPLMLKRVDTGFSRSPFIEQGASLPDPVSIRITAIEI